MAKKILNADALDNELQKSVFFRDRTPIQTESAQGEKGESAHAPIKESAHAPFDLSKRPTEKRGYRFATEEIWAIEDVKTELNRELDLGISQEDIVRSGVHFVIDEYRKNKQKSILVKMVTKKRG